MIASKRTKGSSSVVKRGPDYFDPFFSKMPDSDSQLSSNESIEKASIDSRIEHLRKSVFDPRFQVLQESLTPQASMHGYSPSVEKLQKKTEELLYSAAFESFTKPSMGYREPANATNNRYKPESGDWPVHGEDNLLIERERQLAQRWRTILKNSEERVADENEAMLKHLKTGDVNKSIDSFPMLTEKKAEGISRIEASSLRKGVDSLFKSSGNSNSKEPRSEFYPLVLRVSSLWVEVRNFDSNERSEIMYSIKLRFKNHSRSHRIHTATKWIDAKRTSSSNRNYESCTIRLDLPVSGEEDEPFLVVICRFDTFSGEVREIGVVEFNKTDCSNYSMDANHRFSGGEFGGVLSAYLYQDMGNGLNKSETGSGTKGLQETHSTGSAEQNLVERSISSVEESVEEKWYYLDDCGMIQGPFASPRILRWIADGYFDLQSQFRGDKDFEFQDLEKVINRMCYLGEDIGPFVEVKKQIGAASMVEGGEQVNQSIMNCFDQKQESFKNFLPNERHVSKTTSATDANLGSVIGLLDKAEECLLRIQSHKRSGFLHEKIISRDSPKSTKGAKSLHSTHQKKFRNMSIVGSVTKIQAATRGWLVRKKFKLYSLSGYRSSDLQEKMSTSYDKGLIDFRGSEVLLATKCLKDQQGPQTTHYGYRIHKMREAFHKINDPYGSNCHEYEASQPEPLFFENKAPTLLSAPRNAQQFVKINNGRAIPAWECQSNRGCYSSLQGNVASLAPVSYCEIVNERKEAKERQAFASAYARPHHLPLHPHVTKPGCV